MQLMNIMPAGPSTAIAQTAGGTQNAGVAGDFAQLILAQINQTAGAGNNQNGSAKPTDALMALLSLLAPASAQGNADAAQAADGTNTDTAPTTDGQTADDADQTVLELNFADLLALFLPLLQQQMPAPAEGTQTADTQAAQAVSTANAQPTGDALLQGLLQALTVQAGQPAAVQQTADSEQGAGAQAQPALPQTESLDDAVVQIRELFARLIAADNDPQAEKRMNELRRALGVQNNTAAPQQAQAAVAAEAPAQGITLQADAVQSANPVGFAPETEAQTAVPAGISAFPQQKASDGEAGFSSSYENERGFADTETAARPAAKTALPAENSASRTVAFAPALERAQKNETAAEKSSEALNSGREVFDKIVGKISGMQADGRQEMQIQLKPEFLGKVVIKLTMENGGLVAKITAANAGVQQAFAAQAQTLQNSLQENGLKDVRVVVDAAAVQDTGMRQQGRQNGGQRENARRNWAAVDAAEKTRAGKAMQAYEEFYRSGTVNFLA